MLTKLTIRKFKRFEDVEIQLGNPVVFIGPNNSGKTSAIQALALWDIGLRRWNEKRSGKRTPEKRPGVTVNRRDLVAIPVPEANLLWRGLRVRDVRKENGRLRTSNIRIDLIVEGVANNRRWVCGLEFDYANDESLYCRPLRLSEGKTPDRMPVPDEARSARIAFLPPMSGLAATETRLDYGAVSVRIGEGRTAEVLRNLCFRVHEEKRSRWKGLVEQIESYVCAPAVLEAYATESAREAEPENLFTTVECDRRLDAMRESIAEIQSALKTLGIGSPWSPDIKASDDFLEPLFRACHERLDLPNLMSKRNFYQLVEHIPDSEIDPEIGAMLDAIVAVGGAPTSSD